jgi:hypothetical protein
MLEVCTKLEDNHNQQEPRKKSKLQGTRDVVVILTCLVVLTAILFYVIKDQSNKPSEAALMTEESSNPVIEATESAVVQEPVVKEPTVLYNDEMVVAEDHYRTIKLDLKVDTELSYGYQINSGPSLDFYVVGEEDMFRWERMLEGTEETNFKTYTDFNSSATVKDKKVGKLRAGTYYLIVDNTDYGTAIPPMNLADDISTLQLLVATE